MKRILKTAALFAVLTLVLLATVSCSNIFGELSVGDKENNSDAESTTLEVTTAPAESTTPEATTTAPAESTIPETTTAPAESTTPEATTTAPAESTTPEATTTAPAESSTPEETTTAPEETTTPPTQEHSHVFSAWITTQNATCTEKGLQERSCACGEIETQEINALDHTEVIDVAVSPTCTTDGLSMGVHCGICSEVIVVQEVIPAAHIWAQTELLHAATCFAMGQENRVCRVCGAEETAQIEALEHNFVQDEETKLYACSLCDARIFAGHLYAAFEGGYHWYEAYQTCEDMGGYLVTITSKYEQAVIEDLMNSDLRTRDEYSIGGIRFSSGFQWITGEPMEYQNWEPGEPNFYDQNQYSIIVYSKISTIQTGYWDDTEYKNREGFICEWDLAITECEHIFTEWETTCEATCWNDGEQYRICTYCGVEETEVLPRLTHNFVFVEETGMTSCEHCGAAKYNGHIYALFTDKTSWFDAYSRCEALGGHLATVTSEKEQTFITSYLRSRNEQGGIWLGGYSDAKEWHWVTDELFDHAAWGKGQPNNYSGREWMIFMKKSIDWKWDDLSPISQECYLCEFECEE